MGLIDYGRRMGFVGLVGLVSLGCSENLEPNKGLENTTYSEISARDIKFIEPIRPVSEAVKLDSREVKQLPDHLKLDYRFREDTNFDKILRTYSLDHLKDVLGEKYTNLTREEKKRVEKASKEDKYYILTVCESYLEPIDPSLKNIYLELGEERNFKIGKLSKERKKEYSEIYPWIKEKNFESMDGPDISLISFSEDIYSIKNLSLDFGFSPKPGSFMHTYLIINNLVEFISSGAREFYSKLRGAPKK